MSQLDVIYGLHAIGEVLRFDPSEVKEILVAKGRHGHSSEELLNLARSAGIPVHPRPQDALDRLCQTEHHQGLAAMVKPFGFIDLDDVVALCKTSERTPLVVLLDEIQDPQNLGAILRSAHAMGALAAVFPRHRAVGITPAVRKTSAGAVAHLPIAQVTNLARAMETLFEDAGLWILGMGSDATDPLDRLDLTVPLGVVIGSEGKGLRPIVWQKCQMKAKIPMVGEISSLNASAAAAVTLYEISRQRKWGRS